MARGLRVDKAGKLKLPPVGRYVVVMEAKPVPALPKLAL